MLVASPVLVLVLVLMVLREMVLLALLLLLLCHRWMTTAVLSKNGSDARCPHTSHIF